MRMAERVIFQSFLIRPFGVIVYCGIYVLILQLADAMYCGLDRNEREKKI